MPGTSQARADRSACQVRAGACRQCGEPAAGMSEGSLAEGEDFARGDTEDERLPPPGWWKAPSRASYCQRPSHLADQMITIGTAGAGPVGDSGTSSGSIWVAARGNRGAGTPAVWHSKCRTVTASFPWAANSGHRLSSQDPMPFWRPSKRQVRNRGRAESSAAPLPSAQKSGLERCAQSCRSQH